MADSNWLAGGTITITNNTPLDAPGTAVTDTLPVQLTDGESWPTDLTTGQSVTLDFTYAPKDGTGGTKHVAVALSNKTEFKASADYSIAGVQPKEVTRPRTSTTSGPSPVTTPEPSTRARTRPSRSRTRDHGRPAGCAVLAGPLAEQ